MDVVLTEYAHVVEKMFYRIVREIGFNGENFTQTIPLALNFILFPCFNFTFRINLLDNY